MDVADFFLIGGEEEGTVAEPSKLDRRGEELREERTERGEEEDDGRG